MQLDRMPLDRVNSVASNSVAAVLAILLLVLGRIGGSAAWAEGYVTGSDDVPLMSGLTEVPGSGLVFDKPGGRIVEIQASGSVSSSQVAAFYNSTLPQLGWVPKQHSGEFLKYQRDDEVLAIHLGGGGDVTQVSFSLSPRPADGDGSDSN